VFANAKAEQFVLSGGVFLAALYVDRGIAKTGKRRRTERREILRLIQIRSATLSPAKIK
jgi:hypothetical protein